MVHVVPILFNMFALCCLIVLQFGDRAVFPNLFSWMVLVCALNLLLGFRFLKEGRAKKYDVWAFLRYLALIGNYGAVPFVFVGRHTEGFSPLVVTLFISFAFAIHMLHNLKFVAQPSDKLPKPGADTENYIRRVLLGMVWALSPSDYSILQLIEMQKETDEMIIATGEGSANDAMGSWCVKMKLAEYVPCEIKEIPEHVRATLRNYRLTPKGRQVFDELVKLNIRGGHIPAEAIIIKETEDILRADIAMGRAGAAERLQSLYNNPTKPASSN